MTENCILNKRNLCLRTHSHTPHTTWHTNALTTSSIAGTLHSVDQVSVVVCLLQPNWLIYTHSSSTTSMFKGGVPYELQCVVRISAVLIFGVYLCPHEKHEWASCNLNCALYLPMCLGSHVPFSYPQFLNIKLTDISVPDPDKYPHMVSLMLSPTSLQANTCVHPLWGTWHPFNGISHLPPSNHWIMSSINPPLFIGSSVGYYLSSKKWDHSISLLLFHPTQLTVKNCFIRGSVIRYVQLPAEEVDTALLQDAARKEAAQGKQQLSANWTTGVGPAVCET